MNIERKFKCNTSKYNSKMNGIEYKSFVICDFQFLLVISLERVKFE